MRAPPGVVDRRLFIDLVIAQRPLYAVPYATRIIKFTSTLRSNFLNPDGSEAAPYSFKVAALSDMTREIIYPVKSNPHVTVISVICDQNGLIRLNGSGAPFFANHWLAWGQYQRWNNIK